MRIITIGMQVTLTDMSFRDWLFVLYFFLLAASCVASFGLKPNLLRRLTRILAVILAIPLCFSALALGALIALLVAAEPPSLSSLKSHFSDRRNDLETIVRMSDQDTHFSRIAPTFLDRNELSNQGRYMYGDSNAGLANPRWDEYRFIYKRLGVKLGVQRDGAGDQFIMVDSVGLLNRGHVTGYLFCRRSQAAKDRFQPCTLNKNKGSHAFDPKTHEEGYSFSRIDDSWFAYSEGPS